MNIGIIGQGYVGLTLAVEAALCGHKVVGFDTNIKLVQDLEKGITQVPGIDRDSLISLINEKKYLPTYNSINLKQIEIAIIAVPTPIDKNNKPDLSFIKSAVEIILKNTDQVLLIVNESTSFPGTLRNIIMPLLEKHPVGNLLFASAPERIDPGNLLWNLRNTPRIISGVTNEATNLAFEFYSTICDSISIASSPEVAEAAKLFENTFRQVNIALANEFSEISNKLGFSSHEAIMAASTKPFGYMPFFPSIGVGGHCIPIDPYYLTYISNTVGVQTNLISTANDINSNAPLNVSKRIVKFMGGRIEGKTIQLAGISYKSDTPDLRESPALELIKIFEELGADLSWHDPIVIEYGGRRSVPLSKNIDLGIILNPHKCIDFSLWLENKVNVIDLSSTKTNFGFPKFL